MGPTKNPGNPGVGSAPGRKGNPVRALTAILTVFLACLGFVAPLTAQEGHPLKGSWIGTWGPSQNHSNDIIVILNWDGKAITGMINPGTDNIPIKSATLMPDTWSVHFEAAAKDSTYTFDGKIENLAMHNRSITGTWKSPKESGKVNVQRQ